MLGKADTEIRYEQVFLYLRHNRLTSEASYRTVAIGIAPL